jgi:hypothetical protein
MRLATLVFSSPIAIRKLQNEILPRVLMPHVGRSSSCARRYGGPAMVRSLPESPPGQAAMWAGRPNRSGNQTENEGMWNSAGS